MNEDDYVQSIAKRTGTGNSKTELKTEGRGLGNSHRMNEELSSGKLCCCITYVKSGNTKGRTGTRTTETGHDSMLQNASSPVTINCKLLWLQNCFISSFFN
jgi:hypothetical protein